MKFPIIMIKDRESPIYFFNESEFGLVSKGGEKFYKNGTAYDSEGRQYLINGIKSLQKAPILKSIKYFQPMYKVDVKHETILETLNLSDFKQIVIDHINSHKKYWLSRDTFDSLKNSILSKNSFFDIITFLQ